MFRLSLDTSATCCESWFVVASVVFVMIWCLVFSCVLRFCNYLLECLRILGFVFGIGVTFVLFALASCFCLCILVAWLYVLCVLFGFDCVLFYFGLSVYFCICFVIALTLVGFYLWYCLFCCIVGLMLIYLWWLLCVGCCAWSVLPIQLVFLILFVYWSWACLLAAVGLSVWFRLFVFGWGCVFTLLVLLVGYFAFRLDCLYRLFRLWLFFVVLVLLLRCFMVSLYI